MEFGKIGKPKNIGDALLEMYVSSVQAFVGDKTLMFIIPHHPATEAEYFVQYSGFDPDDPTDRFDAKSKMMSALGFSSQDEFNNWCYEKGDSTPDDMVRFWLHDQTGGEQ